MVDSQERTCSKWSFYAVPAAAGSSEPAKSTVETGAIFPAQRVHSGVWHRHRKTPQTVFEEDVGQHEQRSTRRLRIVDRAAWEQIRVACIPDADTLAPCGCGQWAHHLP